MPAYFKLVTSLIAALTMGACATTSTNMTDEQRAERGAVMIVLKEVDGKTIHLTGTAVNTDLQKFDGNVPGFFMNLGDLPPGILPAMFSNTSQDLQNENGENLTATFKNLPAGEYAFVNLYDLERSNCFGERTKIFDVKPGYVNLVTLPASTGFLKKGFFKSVPETPSVDWDYSVSLNETELLQMYEANLKDHFKIDLPARVSNITEASFEPTAKPAISYVCLLPQNMEYSL